MEGVHRENFSTISAAPFQVSFMKLVSPALKHVIFPVLSRSGYLRHSVGAGPAVVTYHGVFPQGYKMQNPALDGNMVHAESLRRQLLLLKSRYHVISPDDFLRWLNRETSLPPRSVLLTCDDALRNTLTTMLPILSELGLRCLFFATAAGLEPAPTMLWYEELDLMLLQAASPFTLRLPEADLNLTVATSADKHPRWWSLVECLSQFDMETRRRYLDEVRSQLKLSETWCEKLARSHAFAARFLTLDAAGLRQLISAGMTIGAHSLSHPVLARTPPSLAQREISQSRTLLEKALGQPVWAFAYPFGNAATVTRREIDLAERAAYQCAFMNVGGGFGAPFDRFAVPRVHITADMGCSEFEAHLTGFYRSLREKLLGAEKSIGVESASSSSA